MDAETFLARQQEILDGLTKTCQSLTEVTTAMTNAYLDAKSQERTKHRPSFKREDNAQRKKKKRASPQRKVESYSAPTPPLVVQKHALIKKRGRKPAFYRIWQQNDPTHNTLDAWNDMTREQQQQIKDDYESEQAHLNVRTEEQNTRSNAHVLIEAHAEAPTTPSSLYTVKKRGRKPAFFQSWHSVDPLNNSIDAWNRMTAEQQQQIIYDYKHGQPRFDDDTEQSNTPDSNNAHHLNIEEDDEPPPPPPPPPTPSSVNTALVKSRGRKPAFFSNWSKRDPKNTLDAWQKMTPEQQMKIKDDFDKKGAKCKDVAEEPTGVTPNPSSKDGLCGSIQEEQGAALTANPNNTATI